MDKIQELTRQLSQQQQLLRTYSAQRAGAAAKSSKFQKRIRELENIRHSIERKLSDSADDVRKWQSKMRDAALNGVKKHGNTLQLGDQIQSSFEKTPSDDSYMSQILCEIDSELNRCRCELENASGEQSRADNNISTTRANITRIQTRIKEERIKKSGGGSR